jgi:hypothetical protein
VDESKPNEGGRKRRKRITPSSKWALYGASILLLIVSLFGAYYFLYISDRTTLLDQYYLRLLSNSAENVQGTIEGRRGNVGASLKAFRDGLTKELSGTTEPDDGLTGICGRYKNGSDEDPAPDDVAAIDLLASGLIAELQQIDGVDEVDPFRFEPAQLPASERRSLANANGTEMGHQVRAALRRVDGESVIEFRPSLVQGGNVVELARARAELKAILLPALPDEVFGTVLLTRGNGQVLLQSGRSQHRLRELPTSSLRDKKTGEPIADPQASSRTHIRRVDLAGVAYKLFVQPLRVPIELTNEIDERGLSKEDVATVGETDTTEHYWILAGLMPVADLRTEAMVISPTLVLLVVGLFVAGVVSLPYLKIRFLGHREALRSQDVAVLAVAVLVGTSLYTYAIVDLFVYRGLQDTRGDQLEALSSGIQSEVLRELSLAERQLEELTRSQFAGPQPEEPVAKTGLLVKERPHVFAYPQLQMVFWLDKDGHQVAKNTVKNTATPMVTLAEREYFRRARDGDVWELPRFGATVATPPIEGATVELAEGSFVDSIRSKTTGSVYSILSRKVTEPGEGAAAVAALETPLLSLIDPVLPAGFGFAVFDQDGKVLFHSSKERNLRENFFEEIEDDEVLRAAVFAGSDERVTTTYRTRPLDVFVKKMDSLPWTLAVFADADRLRTQHLETLTFALLMLSLYLLLLLLLGIWLTMSDRTQAAPGAVRSNWFWPDPGKVFPYSVLTLAMTVLAVCWGFGVLYSESVSELWRTLLTSVVGVTLIHWVLRTSHLDHEGREAWTESIQFAVVALAIGLVLCIPVFQDRWGPSNLILGAVFLGVLALRRAAPLLGLLIALSIGMALRYEEGWRWTSYGVTTLITVLLVIPWPLLRTRTEAFLSRRGAGSKGMYVACAFSVTVVLGVLPAVSFYRAVHDDVAFLFVKHQQVEFADALRARADQMTERYSGIETGDVLPLQQPPGAAPQDLQHEYHIYSGRDFSRLVDDEADSEQEPLVTSWMKAEEVKGEPEDDATAEAATDTGGVESTQVVVDFLRPYLPQYNESTHRLRDLVDSSAEARVRSRRTWSVHDEPSDDGATTETTLRMRETDYRPALTLGSASFGQDRSNYDPITLELESPVETLGLSFLRNAKRRGTTDLLAWGSLAALALFVLWCVMRSAVRRVFLVDLIHPRALRKTLSESERLGARTLVLEPDEEISRRLSESAQCWAIDCTEIRAAESVSDLISEAVESDCATIVVWNFDEGLDEDDLALKKLQLLEGLNQIGKQNVVVTADRTPLDYFTARAIDSLSSTIILDVDRWATVLEPFEKVRGDASDLSSAQRRKNYLRELRNIAPEPTLMPEDADVLADECWMSPYQRILGRRIAPRMGDLEKDQIVDLVLDHAEAYYRRVWSSCSVEERLLLLRLAQEGFVNWQMEEALRRMLRRRLVVATPAYRLMNESFRRFVLRAEATAVFAGWESQGDVGLFARLRAPLVGALVVLAGFFFATQRESFNHSLGIMTAMATSGPLLIKLMSAAAQTRQKA